MGHRWLVMNIVDTLLAALGLSRHLVQRCKAQPWVLTGGTIAHLVWIC